MTDPVDNRFELRECLLRDGRVVRWRAFDGMLEREVWLECRGDGIDPQGAADDDGQIAREAKMLARVRHGGVARLLEVVTIDGRAALVLEPAQGERLDELLAREGRLDGARVVQLGVQLARAAGAVHEQGVVHRGIAAANVTVSADGRATLLGFTFAKPGSGGGATSLHHGGVGSRAASGLPDYSAPEQIAGQAADHRADVFALGCLLFRCATGHEVDPAVSGRAAPDVEPSVSRALLDVLARCTARSASARYPNMAAVADALDSLTPTGRPVSKAWLAAGCALAVVAAGFVWRGTGTTQDAGKSDPIANPSVHDATFSGARALLVGIDYADNTEHGRLRNPVRDVAAIRARLVAMGWAPDHIEVLTDGAATGVAIERGLRKLELAGPEEQVFVYVAGHGEVHEVGAEASGYFVPADGGVAGLGPDARAHWVPFDAFRRCFVESRAKHVLIALDCCHAGAALRGRRADAATPPPPRAIAEHVRRRAHVLLCSALGEEYASDGAGEHSPFAVGVLRALDRAIGGQPVTSSEVYVEVVRELQAQKAPQCSWRRAIGGADAEFVFLPGH